MSKIYIYVVDRDFGFAPNPFHGCCTLATCKPGIRRSAKTGDWVMGMGGARLRATGRCIFAMRVTDKLTFNEYWQDAKYLDKKPVRNGSRKMMVGDNIYRHDPASNTWHQSDSHHSNADGTTNHSNLTNDTKSIDVLVSRDFYYFGRDAPKIPNSLLQDLGYRNGRNYRVFDFAEGNDLISWLRTSFEQINNLVSSDPFDFDQSGKRYSAATNKIH